MSAETAASTDSRPEVGWNQCLAIVEIVFAVAPASLVVLVFAPFGVVGTFQHLAGLVTGEPRDQWGLLAVFWGVVLGGALLWRLMLERAFGGGSHYSKVQRVLGFVSGVAGLAAVGWLISFDTFRAGNLWTYATWMTLVVIAHQLPYAWNKIVRGTAGS